MPLRLVAHLWVQSLSVLPPCALCPFLAEQEMTVTALLPVLSVCRLICFAGQHVEHERHADAERSG